MKELRSQFKKEQNSLYKMRNGLVYRKRKDKSLVYIPHTRDGTGNITQIS